MIVEREVPKWIRTYTGRRFYPLAPCVDDIEIADIAHALSNQCRFSGHCPDHYSVAIHSVYVSKVVESLGGAAQEQMWGLLHDASEAYLVDIPTPVKRQISGYDVAERAVMAAVCDKFMLPKEEPPLVKRADNIMLSTEARDLMGNPGKEWGLKEKPAKFTVSGITPYFAKSLFLKQFEYLKLQMELEMEMQGKPPVEELKHKASLWWSDFRDQLYIVYPESVQPDADGQMKTMNRIEFTEMGTETWWHIPTMTVEKLFHNKAVHFVDFL